MPHHDTAALTGVIRNVFAHRFTLEAEGRMHLADLGPKGLEAFPVSEGLAVTLLGERRPSEIKILEISADGRDKVQIHHKKPHHALKDAKDRRPDMHGADQARVLRAVRESGWSLKGEPRRKPKHLEVLARRDGGDWMELHVDATGEVYKTKPADAEKWAVELG